MLRHGHELAHAALSIAHMVSENMHGDTTVLPAHAMHHIPGGPTANAALETPVARASPAFIMHGQRKCAARNCIHAPSESHALRPTLMQLSFFSLKIL